MIVRIPHQTVSDNRNWAVFTRCEIRSRQIRFGVSGQYRAHRKSRLTPSPECVPPAARISLVRRAAAGALHRLALEPPPRRIENARVRLGKGNRQHPS
jgi:hypothetical protein